MPDDISMMPQANGTPDVVDGYGGDGGQDPLAMRVSRDFTAASSARIYQEQKVFVRAMFNSKAYYAVNMQFPSGTSQVFVNATRPKVQTAVALLMPLTCTPGQNPFTIDPDPESIDPSEAMDLLKKGMVPDEIRDELFQRAGKKSDRLTAKIRKGMDFTRFNDKMLRYLWDLSLFGTGVIVGPLAVENPEASDASQTDNSVWDSIANFFSFGDKQPHPYQGLFDVGLLDQYLPVIDVVSPLDFYPDPAAYSVEQSRFGIWRMTLSKAQVLEMVGNPSFKQDVVEDILQKHPDGHWQPAYWESAINALNNQPAQTVPNGRYLCYQWWGFLTGKDLHDAGVKEIPASKFKDRVIANIWTIAGQTVKVGISELHNERLPFYVTPYSISPNSIWGVGPPEMMFDAQDAINALERALMDNMAICHAPQVMVDVDQLSDPTQTLSIQPRMIWAIRSKPGITMKPVEFFYPPTLINEILAAINHERELAQEQTGLPNFLSGMNNGSETHNRTFGGFSLQFNNALTTLKTTAYNIENTLIVPLVQKFIRFTQLYSSDPMVKGSFQVTAHGVRGLMARESFTGAMAELFQSLGNMPKQLDRIKWTNVFNSYFRNAGLANEDLVYTDEEYAKIQAEEQKQEQLNAAHMAGIQASVQSTPKERAEMPIKDVVVEMVKQSPENSDLRLSYMDLVNKMNNIQTPEIAQAMQQEQTMHHMANLDTAHAAGHNIAQRHMEPVPNPLSEHPNLMPPSPGGANE